VQIIRAGTAADGMIFADDFESGTMLKWSNAGE
jgi:hypothetical protein